MVELRGPDSTDDTDSDAGIDADGVTRAPEPQSYSAYLKLPALLALQRPMARPAVHDEMLFIIVHQTHELWFKQILCELTVLVDDIDAGHFDAGCRTLERMCKIARLLGEHMRVLQTMPAHEFKRFRSVLGTASGLESEQFRRLEQLAGLNPKPVRWRADAPSASVREAFWRALAVREPLGVDPRVGGHEQLGQLLARLLVRPELAPQQNLAEAMLAFDDQVVLWRREHFHLARGMLAAEAGTGGTSGAAYLKAAMDRRFFPELAYFRAARAGALSA